MYTRLTLVVAYLFALTSSVLASDWKVGTYGGQTVASTKTSKAAMSLKYDPKAQVITLQFRYRGDVVFTKRNSDQAKFFMRTRQEAKLSGQYSSDYIFTGKTVVNGSPDPNVMQLVTVTLSQEDISALRKYEKFNVIGASYYTNKGWRSYTLPAKGMWNAYLEVAPRNYKAPSIAEPKKQKNKGGALYCIKLRGKAAELATLQKQQHKQSVPIMAQLRSLRSEVDKLKAEMKRLEQVAKIMRSRPDIQANYGRAVDSYNSAVKRFNAANADVRRRNQEYNATQREQKSLYARINRECS